MSLKFIVCLLTSFRPTPAKAGGEPGAGKGTGNFFEDKKVASPQLDSRLHGNDERKALREDISRKLERQERGE
jgi:hypothetical protein